MSGNIFDGSVRSELKEFLTKHADAKDEFIKSVESFFHNWRPHSADDVTDWIYKYPKNSIPPLKQILENKNQTQLLEKINTKASESAARPSDNDSTEKTFWDEWRRMYCTVGTESRFKPMGSSEDVLLRIEKIENKMSQQDKVISDLKDQVSYQTNRITSLTQLVDKLEKDIRNKDNAIQNLTSECQTLKEAGASMQNLFNKTIETKDAEIQELKRQRKELKQRLKEAEREKEKANEEKKRVEDDLQQKLNRAVKQVEQERQRGKDDLKQKLSEVANEKEEVEKERKRVEDNLRKELEKANKKVEKVEKERKEVADDFQKRIAQAEKEKEEVEEDKQREEDNLKKKLEEVEKERKDMEDDFIKKLAEAEKKREDVEEEKKWGEDFKNKLEAIEAQLKESRSSDALKSRHCTIQ